MRECDKVIIETLSLAEKLIGVADKGDEVREDDSCGILYATVRDSGYKIKAMAEKEIERHKRKGLWKE